MYGIKGAAASTAAAGAILIITHPGKTDSSGMIRQIMQLLSLEQREREARNGGAKKLAKLTPLVREAGGGVCRPEVATIADEM